jgi:hypothetical protein
MSDKRYLFREARAQAVIQRRLAEARIRQGLHLNSTLAVSYETLLDVRRQLEEYLAKQLTPDTKGTH